MSKKYSGFIVIFFILVLWEVLSKTAIVNNIFLPPFSKVIKTFFTLIFTSEMWVHIYHTLLRCFTGYFVAALVGVPIGLIMGRSNKIYNLLEPSVEILRPIPSAAIIPVAILFLGIDNSMKIFVITFACLWPILINTIAGVHGIDKILIETAQTFKLSKGKFLVDIVFPASLPGIITGMRISLAIALILAVTVEMIAGNNGIGFFILESERTFLFPEMYAAVICIGVIGYIINKGFLRVTSLFISWHKNQDKLFV